MEELAKGRGYKRRADRSEGVDNNNDTDLDKILAGICRECFTSFLF